MNPQDAGLSERELPVAQMRNALAIYGQWAIDVSTLGEFADLEARMNAAGTSFEEVGGWSSDLAKSLSHPAQPVSTGDGVVVVTDDLIERLAGVAVDTDIIPLTGKYEGSPGVRIGEYLEMRASDAVELGVTLLEKDAEGKPRYHWLSYIRDDEWRDFQIALMRPIVRGILSALTLSTSEASPPAVELKCYDDLPEAEQARIRSLAKQFGVPVSAAFNRAKELGLLSAAPSPEASQPDAGEVKLPKLPKPAGRNYDHGADMGMPYFSEEQMFAYAKRAVRTALSPTDGANNGAASDPSSAVPSGVEK